MRTRVTQELGRSRCLHAFGSRIRVTGERNPRPVGRSVLKPTGAKSKDAGDKWYRRVKETKRGETGSEKS